METVNINVIGWRLLPIDWETDKFSKLHIQLTNIYKNTGESVLLVTHE
jgi:hypothetical protein